MNYMSVPVSLMLLSLVEKKHIASGLDAVHHGALPIRALRHDAEARGRLLEDPKNEVR